MSIRKALAFSFLDRYASLALTIVASMVMARLLTPSEIGVFSVTMVLMSLATTFRDMGAGQYLVQERELTTERIRAVWALQLAIGLTLAVLALGLAYPAAAFYGEPVVATILQILALTYLINPIASITYAWLTREVRFEAIALMRFSSTVVGTVISVWLAWRGWGPLSLAWGALGSTVANAAMAIALRPRGYPWRPSWRGSSRVLSFGYRVSFSSFSETVAQAVPELALGKFQGMNAVGLFSRGNGLVAMFARLVSDAVNVVAMSMFAKGAREQGQIGDAFVRSHSYMTALGWTFSVFVMLMADPLISLLYGPQWGGSVDVTRVLALGLAATMPAAMCFQALISTGASQALLAGSLQAGGLMVAASGVSAWWGMLPMASAMACASLVGSFCWLRQAARHVNFDRRRLAAGMARSLGVAAIASLPPLATTAWWGLQPAEHRLAILTFAMLGTSAGFVLGVWLTRHPLLDELRTLAVRLPRR